MHDLGPPSPWIERFLPAIRPGGTVLDVACGSGRHLAAAAQRGLLATGIDRDISNANQLGDLTGVGLREIDLETGAPWQFAAHSFDAVIVANYLWRPILADLVATVAPNGVLIYETFAVGNECFGKPSNPDFLLQPGELLDAVSGKLVPIAYEHLRLENPDRVIQRICALGRDHEGLSQPLKV